MEMEITRQGILWECFDEISFYGNEFKFITSNNEETYIKMSLLNFFSPLFSTMLGEISLNITQDNIVVHLPSVKKTTLTKLFDVLNYGVTAAYSDIPDDDLEDLKAAAQILGIRGFCELSVNIARVPATEVFPKEVLPLPLDYSCGGKLEEERGEVVEEEEGDGIVEMEEENFAENLQQASYDKEDDQENEEREKVSCNEVSVNNSASLQASSVFVSKKQSSPEVSYHPSECLASSAAPDPASIPLPPPSEYDPLFPEYSPLSLVKFQFPKSKSPVRTKKMFDSDENKNAEAVPHVKKDHKVEKEKPRNRKISNSSERRRPGGGKRRRSHDRTSENRSSRERGSSSWRGSDSADDLTRGRRRRVLLPRPEQDLRSEGPPISRLPELQYIYDNKHHKLCGKVHRRIDLCDMAPVHETCGRRHSYGMECSGAWMTLTRFESLAARWSTSKMIAERLNRSREDQEREDRKRRRLTTPAPLSQNSTCCSSWNFGICLDTNCKKRHRCSVETRPGVVCLGKHRAPRHSSAPDRIYNSRK